MCYKKIVCLLLFVIIISCLFTINIDAQESPFECSTDPELIQEGTNALIQKKLAELNKEYSPFDSDISLFSQFIGYQAKGLMPSTGNVRILVLPIEFADIKMSESRYAGLYDEFFADYDASKPYRELSVHGMYKRLSYGKLNVTGDVLPLYTASKNRGEYDATQIGALITEALNSYDINYADYDSDKDGYIDCLIVKHPFPGLKPWMTWMISALGVKPDKANGLKFYSMVLSSTTSNDAATDVHEMGHMMGLPDNYLVDTQNNCILEANCADVMGSGQQWDAGYFNIYHRYLLDWVEPEVLPYTDTLQDIELNAVELYTDETADKNKAVLFIPDTSLLPFSEFYIAEYRAGGLEDFYTNNPGIVLWHCNTSVNNYGQYVEPGNYIKPVYKSGGTSYAAKDVYIPGDEFSDSTNPSSKFYDGIYTGAYMKVLATDSQKATISAGFKEPDLSPAPNITISPPSKKAVKSGTTVTYSVKYQNYTNIFLDSSYILINAMGDVSASPSHSSKNNVNTVYLESITGEGILGFSIPKNTAVNGSKVAPAAISETFYVDNTPPEIVLNGNSEITLVLGDTYTEQGAQITDNLDPDIESKLVINNSSVKTNQLGTYSVTYNAKDHAGNKAQQVVRTVKVVDQKPPLTAQVQYSTDTLTNQDVTVTLLPSEAVTEDTILTHTFTENGSYTFTLTDLFGNMVQIPVEVTWIDKTPPTAEVEYSTASPTNRDVTAKLVNISELIKESDLSYTFTQNGEHTFTITDQAGNTAAITARVDWIDKIAPQGTVSYSTTEATNRDVTATVTFDKENVRVTNNNGSASYTFTEDGEFIFEFEDAFGNAGTATAKVSWIDKAVPKGTVIYSTTAPTNQNVTATVIFDKTNVTVTNNNNSNTYVFTGNNEFTFEFEDALGNKGTATARVTWIDKSVPQGKIAYSTSTPTNQNVTAVICFDKDNVTVTNNNGSTSYIFTKNDEFTFEFEDSLGNKGTATAKVNWINKTPPKGIVSYSTASLTNGDVTAEITFDKEDVTITNNDGKLSYVFTQNGAFIFEFEDALGNKGVTVAEVSWIDKTPPTAEIEYSTVSPTNGDVIAKLVHISETIKENDLSYTFTENGEHTFTITDEAGNTAAITAKVDWIDKSVPQGEVSYSIPDLTNKDVTATVRFDKANVTVTNNGGSASYTFKENGEFTFEFEDALGNKGTAIAKVNWIDKAAPKGTISYSTTDLTNGNVTATIRFDKANVAVTNNNSNNTYVFTQNGEFIFEFQDALGNTGTATAKVDWINEVPLPPVDTMEPIGEYNNTVRIEKCITEDRLMFTITSLTGQELPQFNLFIAEYDEDGSLTKVQVGNCIIQDNSVVISANLAGFNRYKIILWDDTQRPLIDCCSK